jgi:microcystin-dependent protein
MPALGLYDNGLQNGLIGSYSEQASANTQMGVQAISLAGGNQPHNNMQPYLTLSFCIALQGVFPPRQ